MVYYCRGDGLGNAVALKYVDSPSYDMDPKRKELIQLLTELSEVYPNMRFGQLVINVAHWARGPTVEAAWDVTDEEMIQAAKKNLQRHKAKGK